MELKITEIQGFSLHDGPGIRTTLFLAGCPLHCAWCHNPETQSVHPILVYEEEKCIGCKKCGLCPNGVHTFENGHELLREKCTLCGECIKACPNKALRASIKTLDEQGFVELVEKQKYIAKDRGGITFSGGEPMMQADVILAFLEKVKIHTAIETCGYVDSGIFRRVIEKMDYVMYDLKLADDKLHKQYTGVSNELILDNLKILRESGKPFVVRTPLIPGITDTAENLSAIEKIVGKDKWEKLPYNPLAPVKYAWIGRSYTL